MVIVVVLGKILVKRLNQVIVMNVMVMDLKSVMFVKEVDILNVITVLMVRLVIEKHIIF